MPEVDSLDPKEDVVLYRVVSMRKLPSTQKELRHTNWFATKEAAENHKKWIENGRGRVLTVAKYQRVYQKVEDEKDNQKAN